MYSFAVVQCQGHIWICESLGHHDSITDREGRGTFGAKPLWGVKHEVTDEGTGSGVGGGRLPLPAGSGHLYGWQPVLRSGLVNTDNNFKDPK